MSSTTAATAPTKIHPLWWLLLLAAALAVVGFGFALSQRLFYPHELEWMEGALADHASRIRDGLPLYCAPGPEHVPFLYAPMLFWLGGLGMTLGIDGMLALRLVATLSSIACAMLIGHWVRRETGKVVPGLVATGLFLAGYGWLAWWYDLARNDSLFVFWCLCTAYQLRHGGRARWFWAGLLATAALLAKQSALMWLPAVGVGALLYNWRDAVRFGLTAVSAMCAAIGLMHLCSDGWSTFYLFEMPQHHGWVGDRKLGYWTQDILPMLPLIALGLACFVDRWRQQQRREALYLAAFGCGGLMTSWFSRMHVGGFDNVMMYGFAGACVLGPIAAATKAPWLRVLVPIMLLAQFGLLGYAAWQRSPQQTMLPSAAHRKAHDELRAFVEEQDGPVWIPGHGGISYRAGKGTGAHGQAIFDLLQLLPKLPNGMLNIPAMFDPSQLAHLSPRAREAIGALLTGTRDALRERRFAAIVVDRFGDGAVDAFTGLFAGYLHGEDGIPGSHDDPYVRRQEPLLTQPTAINPLLGYRVHSPHVLVPRK